MSPYERQLHAWKRDCQRQLRLRQPRARVVQLERQVRQADRLIARAQATRSENLTNGAGAV